MAESTRVGYDFAHAIVDDHSRLAYVELHSDGRAGTVTAFTARALDWFAKHLRTQPYRPEPNGKVERFHQTMAREWAYGLTYRSHSHRNEALPHWLEHYNKRRPHSGIGNRPPVSRVHNRRGQDSQP